MSNPTPTRTHHCLAYGGATVTSPPGHTLGALRKAVEVGAAMLYVEARVTRDGVLVASPSQVRVAGGQPVSLADRDLAVWLDPAAAPAGEPVGPRPDPATPDTLPDSPPLVTLDEVIGLAHLTGCALGVELRAPGAEMPLARKLRASDLPYDRLLVAIAPPAGRTVMRSLDPRLPLAHRFPSDPTAKVTPELLKRIDASAVIWPAAALTREIVRGLKARGVAVYGGPVRLWSEMQRLQGECGVDGILTPHPELLLAKEIKRAA